MEGDMPSEARPSIVEGDDKDGCDQERPKCSCDVDRHGEALIRGSTIRPARVVPSEGSHFDLRELRPCLEPYTRRKLVVHHGVELNKRHLTHAKIVKT